MLFCMYQPHGRENRVSLFTSGAWWTRQAILRDYIQDPLDFLSAFQNSLDPKEVETAKILKMMHILKVVDTTPSLTGFPASGWTYTG